MLFTLKMLNALGASRKETLDGRDYLVVPVVALMEGVIHAVNADAPEFVSKAVLAKAAESWNGRPVTLGHPTRDGAHVSANDPKILSTWSIGTVFNARIEGKKLLCEAWIDVQRASRTPKGQQMLTRLEQNEMEEVSVGASVKTAEEHGEYDGKKYAGVWLETSGDHLAFLPGGRGACSIDMGCGAGRAASAMVDGDTLKGLPMKKSRGLRERFGSLLKSLSTLEPPEEKCAILLTLEGVNLTERLDAVSRAVAQTFSSAHDYAYATTVYDDNVIIRVDDKLYRCNYSVVGDEVLLGEPMEVKQKPVEYVAAGMKECTVCAGTGQVDGADCAACDGNGSYKAAATAVEEIPAVTPEACTCGNHAALSEGQTMKKDELVKALAANEYSAVRDVKILEAMSEDALNALNASAAATKSAVDKTAADLKAAQDKTAAAETEAATLKAAAEKVPTEEEYLKTAPESVRTLVANEKAREAKIRTETIAQLKVAAANIYTEEELNAKTTSDLLKLAAMAKIDVEVDYSAGGLNIPAPRAAANVKDYAPVDPWSAGIKTLQEQTKTH